MSFMLLDLEATAAARTERVLCLGFDHRGGRNLDWSRSCRPGFELEELLAGPSERLAQHTRAWIDRRTLWFGAGHGERGVTATTLLL